MPTYLLPTITQFTIPICPVVCCCDFAFPVVNVWCWLLLCYGVDVPPYRLWPPLPRNVVTRYCPPPFLPYVVLGVIPTPPTTLLTCCCPDIVVPLGERRVYDVTFPFVPHPLTYHYYPGDYYAYPTLRCDLLLLLIPRLTIPITHLTYSNVNRLPHTLPQPRLNVVISLFVFIARC